MSGTTNTAERLAQVQTQADEVREQLVQQAAQQVRDAVDQQESIDELARKADAVRAASKAFSPTPVQTNVDDEPKVSRGRRALDAVKNFFTAIGNGFVRFGNFVKEKFTALGQWFKNLRKPKAETSAPAASVVAEQKIATDEVPASPRGFQGLGGRSLQASPGGDVDMHLDAPLTQQQGQPAVPVVQPAAPMVQQQQQPAAPRSPGRM